MGFVDDFKADLAQREIKVTIDTVVSKVLELNDEYLEAALKDVVIEALQAAANEAPVDTGQLAESLRDTTVTVNKVSQFEYRVLANEVVDYAQWIEDGRSPGKFPPPDKLLPWVQRNMGLSGDEAKRVAFLIGRKMAKQGKPGLEFIQEAIDLVASTSDL